MIVMVDERSESSATVRPKGALLYGCMTFILLSVVAERSEAKRGYCYYVRCITLSVFLELTCTNFDFSRAIILSLFCEAAGRTVFIVDSHFVAM